ncbi:MAG: glycosyltransferase [Actinomycetota bacterium]|nr:glycosyltransferase [Actinomycetota bacterium]
MAELARHTEVWAVVADEDRASARRPVGCELLSVSEFGALGGHDRVDLSVYHIGNHHGYHHWIHDEAVRVPGLVVLHDPSLLDLYRALHLGDDASIQAELRHNYGPINLDDQHLVPFGRYFDHDRMAIRLVRRLVETSRAVVVHNRWSAEDLTRRFPHRPIFHVELAVPLIPDEVGLPLRARLGWGPAEVAFGVLGGLWPHKRIDIPVRAFAAVHQLDPRARLLVAGRVEDLESLRDVRRIIDEAGITGAVRILADLDADEFTECLSAVDALVDLRPPTAGETPATVMRALGAGRPVIVTDLPQLRGLDDRFCWRMPTGPVDAAEAATKTMALITREPFRATLAGRVARDWVASEASLPVVAERFIDIARGVVAERRTGAVPAPVPVPPVPSRTEPAPSVNVIGDFRATTGLMEAARQAVQAMTGVGVDVHVVPYLSPSPVDASRVLPDLEALPHGRADHAVDLWFVNVDDFRALSDDELRPPHLPPRHVVAWWYWEAATLPSFARNQVARVDEIWASSRFVQSTFGAATESPVSLLPCVVEAPMPPDGSRRDFGLPDDAVLFLFTFDANSSDARKNPWGLIEAFGRAFDAAERAGQARLVLKVQNLAGHPLERPLTQALDAVDGILLDGELSRSEMNVLLGSVDVYASLHRAEGFGLGMAEAMFLGKPVIATAYSGNVDFTAGDNSCPVGYRLRPIELADHRYRPLAAGVYEPGLLWADPDLDQAGRWMRFLFEHPEARRRIGANAAATVRSRYSSSAVGAAIAGRLTEIGRNLVPAGAGEPHVVRRVVSPGR